jgi:hypothetical protein
LTGYEPSPPGLARFPADSLLRFRAFRMTPSRSDVDVSRDATHDDARDGRDVDARDVDALNTGGAMRRRANERTSIAEGDDDDRERRSIVRTV